MKKNKRTSLRKQFNLRLSIILISITVISGIVQYQYISKQIRDNVARESEMIGNSIEQGISETDLASRAIEQQIDYKLESISQRIAEELPNHIENVTTEDLLRLQDKLHVAGIDLFAKDNDIVSVVKSTDSDEIGFTLEGVSEMGNQQIHNLLNEAPIDGGGIASYVNDNIAVLYSAQAGSREEPMFFKYAYYHEPGTDYVISAFIEANEVYQFTQKVGPNSWINKVLDEYEFAKEIAVLDPRVFADPSLAEKMYPPLNKVVYGEYNFQTDEQVLINMVESPKKVTLIEKHNGEKIYKMFIPYNEGNVIYVAMDYDEMAAPFTNYSLILISFGFIALLILFLTTTRFFNKIYGSISKIIEQIKSLEKGDFTARSKVNDKGELGQLSYSTNTMADTLNDVLSQTKEQAEQTERHSYLLESEANNSVGKVYTMSMEATTESRENTEEIYFIMEQIEKDLSDENDRELKDKLAKVRELVQSQSNSTTEMTITLSDLLKSLHSQSSSLSDISKKLLKSLDKFELSNKDGE